MNEALLHYLWQTQQFEHKSLKTVDGRDVFVIHPGYHNQDAGPDFLHAKIRIGQELWAGHVEIHTRSSDWTAHKHSDDPAYQNVVLHVVFAHDRNIKAPRQLHDLPTVELKNRISLSLIDVYRQFYEQKQTFPCEKLFHHADRELITLTIQRMAVERLEEKATNVQTLWAELNKDWTHTLFSLTAKSLAGPVNGPAALTLMKNLNPLWLLRSKDQLVPLEALILGAAGLLNDPNDDYSKKLRTEYLFWRKKYPIVEMTEVHWKYSRMRPDNFIDLRLAQFAQWVHQNDAVWPKMLSCTSWKELKAMFNITLRNYWRTHYRLGHESNEQVKRLGIGSTRLIVVNAIAPLLFLYGKETNRSLFQEKAMEWLTNIPPEDNKIVRAWQQFDIKPDNGFEAQGLLYWKKQYCDNKQCAKCPVGHNLMRSIGDSRTESTTKK